MRWIVWLLLFPVTLLAEQKVKQATGSVIRTKGKIQTGSSSRIELELPYLAVARIGSHATLRFNATAKALSLEGGTLMLSVPKETSGITVESGSTMTSFSKGALQMSNVDGRVKVITLDGKITVTLAANPSDRRRLKDGDMVDVPAGATTMPPVTTIKLRKLIETSVLINMGPFPGLRAIKQNATSQKGPMKPFVTGGFDPDWGGGSLLSYGPPGTAAMIRLMEAGKPEPLPVVPPGELPTQSQAEIFAAAGKPVPNVTTQEGRRILRGDRLRVLRDRLRPPVPVATPAPTPQPTRPPVISPPIATPRPTIRPPIAPP